MCHDPCKLLFWAVICSVLSTFHTVSSQDTFMQIPHGATPIKNKHAYLADKGLMGPFIQECLRNPYQNPKQIHSQSIETLIDYIERLEMNLLNTTDQLLRKFQRPDDVARLILHRFNLEDIDFDSLEPLPPVRARSNIDTEIMGVSKLVGLDYYFPDYLFNRDELCTMLFMFSHYYMNISNPNSYNNQFRFKRDSYTFNRDNSHGTNGQMGQPMAQSYQPTSGGLNPSNQVMIQEKGVVTFRNNPEEAISPARVLIGIVAGLTTNFNADLTKISPKYPKEESFKDPLLAITLGSIAGSASFYESGGNLKYQDKMIFGVRGKWIDDTCCMTYVITEPISSSHVGSELLSQIRFSSRASMAQLRGALDGYIIGKTLRTIDTNGLKLSTILRSYYSPPRSRHGQKLSVTYCDRNSAKPQPNDLTNEAELYGRLYTFIEDQEHFNLKNDLFNAAMAQMTNTPNEICQQQHSSSLDRNSACETPSDLLFVIDTKNYNQSARMVNEILKHVRNIGRFTGTASVFFMSNSRPSSGNTGFDPTTSWPLGTLIFNATNIGTATCSFKTIDNPNQLQPISNYGKFFKDLNQTINNYRYWQPRRWQMNWMPAKNVFIIDQGSLKEPSDDKDRDDFKDYRWELKNSNRDVRYFIFSSNDKIYEDIIDKKEDLFTSPMAFSSSLSLQKRFCETPAILTYERCYEKASENVQMNHYITPGNKQCWAMFPEYFIKSYDIEIKIKPYDGSIKYCFGRQPNPEDLKDDEYDKKCEDLTPSKEATIKISNPCHHRNVHSCDPFYFTIWGNDKTTPCKDIACQGMDQIKFSITHKGVSCNSAGAKAAVFIIQLVCCLLAYINYYLY